MLNRLLLPTLAAVMLWAVPALAQDDKIDLEGILKDKAAQPAVDVKGEIEKLEPGDKAEFTVATRDDTSSLEVGDIYKNNGCFFKVISIKSKGNTGGKFVVQRTAGRVDPGLKWQRVSGLGPISIASTQSLLDLYIAGGPFLHPIAVLCLCMIVLAVNSLWIYRYERQCPSKFIEEAERLLDAGQIDKFTDLANRTRGLLPAICRSLTHRFATSEPDDIKERASITASANIARLRTPVRALNLIAAAAPLLGLLGTIVGMIIVFEAIGGASGTAKAQALAAGIRVKLFSTTAALMVAIPSLFLFFVFNQKLTSIIARAELITEGFVHQLTVIKRNGGKAEAKVASAVNSEGNK